MGLLGRDVHHFHSETKHVPYDKTVTVNEHRAPTDKSVELLNEMERKATENIIHKFRVDSNLIKAAVIYYSDAIATDDMIVHIKFELNGKEHVLEERFPNKEFRKEMYESYQGFGSKSVFVFFYKKISEIIAVDLMNKCPDFTDTISKLQ